ncbi:hypothetical protein FDP41_008097 [Naegleria fowleri]|uniref:Uncharacterized protein n=1 Tax=Naegleria fowleri TaxID=5763 RepID=A0A6A5B2U2_NAEFO|nr:uncharacterized protein FDP41_008097 [Naegleria fowleri]KAF0973393.1 hypothetical protein FDP41_008097 [Naegleria fowleri]
MFLFRVRRNLFPTLVFHHQPRCHECTSFRSSLGFILLDNFSRSIILLKKSKQKNCSHYHIQRLFDEKRKHNDPLLNELQDMVKQRPNTMTVDLMREGTDAMEKQDWNTALQIFRRYVNWSRGKKLNRGQQDKLITSFRNISIIQMRQRNYVDAILELNAALNLEKRHPSRFVDLKLLRAECFIELQDFEKAKRDCVDAIELFQKGNMTCDTNKMYYFMGLCFFKADHLLSEAISSLQIALDSSESHSFDRHIYQLLGEICVRLKKYPDAQLYFTKAIHMVENGPFKNESLNVFTDLYLARSRVWAEMHEFEKSLQDCDTLTQRASTEQLSLQVDEEMMNTLHSRIQAQKEQVLKISSSPLTSEQ